MIEALVGGKLIKQAVQRTSQNGKQFTTCTVRVAINGDETVFCSVIAFDSSVQSTLFALGVGDAVSLAGSLKPKVYESEKGTQASLDMVASAILTPYSIKKKRDAVQAHRPAQKQKNDDDFGDPLP